MCSSSLFAHVALRLLILVLLVVGSAGIFAAFAPSAPSRLPLAIPVGHRHCHGHRRCSGSFTHRARTELHLFDLRKGRGGGESTTTRTGSKSHRASSGVRVAFPKLAVQELSSPNCTLPYGVDLKLSNTGTPLPTRRLVVRYLDTPDIDQVVRQCVDEFGSSTPSPGPAASSLPGQLVEQPRNPLDEIKDRFEDWTLSLTVRLGLVQRIARRKDATAPEPDHHVLCLVEEGGAEAPDGQQEPEECASSIVGIVELSQQVPDPEQTALPFVVPIALKRLLGQIDIANRAAVSLLGTEPLPYISNVLVVPEQRGRGYGRILMAAAEGLARKWARHRRGQAEVINGSRININGGDITGNTAAVCLHVDADSTSGRAAQGLYKSLGYKGVADDRTGVKGGGKFSWMGADMLSTGLYMVDDVPLLFMMKELD